MRIDTKEDFDAFFGKRSAGGFAYCYAADVPDYEDHLKSLQVTPRNIPLESKEDTGTCIFTGAENAPLTIFSRAY